MTHRASYESCDLQQDLRETSMRATASKRINCQLLFISWILISSQGFVIPFAAFADNCYRPASFPLWLLLEHLFVFVPVSFALQLSCVRVASNRFPPQEQEVGEEASNERTTTWRHFNAAKLQWGPLEAMKCQICRGRSQSF